jgi:hypothetical protein
MKVSYLTLKSVALYKMSSQTQFSVLELKKARNTLFFLLLKSATKTQGFWRNPMPVTIRVTPTVSPGRH